MSPQTESDDELERAEGPQEIFRRRQAKSPVLVSRLAEDTNSAHAGDLLVEEADYFSPH